MTSTTNNAPPPDWYNYHSEACGTAHRGCAPDCPKDVFERTGNWIGPGVDEDVFLDAHNEYECVLWAWFLNHLHQYTEDALAMTNREWRVETHDEIKDGLYEVYLVGPATGDHEALFQRATFKNPRYRAVYAMSLRRRLNLTPTRSEIREWRKVLPELYEALQLVVEGRGSDPLILECLRRTEELTNRWLTERIRQR